MVLSISTGIISVTPNSVVFCIIKSILEANGLEVVEVETMGEWAVIISKVKGE